MLSGHVYVDMYTVKAKLDCVYVALHTTVNTVACVQVHKQGF